MIDLAPGLSYWLAPHPDWEEGDNWPREVPSFRLESADGVVLIDPLLPPGGDTMFDDDPPAHVLLTAPWHARDAERIVERYGASSDLPRGVEALHPDGDPEETLFYLREQRALITGDAFSGTDGHFRVFLGDQEREPFVKWLPRLLELPIEQVLVAHGPFVLENGVLALREAIGEATIEVLLEHARVTDDVLGVYLFGSRGRPDGLRDERSDWDAGVVLRDEPAKEAFVERWPFVHGSPVEVVAGALDELRTRGDYGTDGEWARYLYVHVDLLLDKTGEIAAILREKRSVPQDVRDGLIRDALGAYVNSTYRSLRHRMVGAGLGSRLDAAESLSPLLTFLYAVEGRVRPFNKYVETEPPAVADLPERLTRVLEGDATAQHALFRDVERLARAHGYGDAIDEWEPDVAWLRGDARYREPE